MENTTLAMIIGGERIIIIMPDAFDSGVSFTAYLTRGIFDRLGQWAALKAKIYSLLLLLLLYTPYGA